MKSSLSRSSGFTLIELLLVLAIIALLSSIILASTNSARVKAADAAIKVDIRSVVQNAALDYPGNGSSYGDTPYVTNQSNFTAGTGVPGSTSLFNDRTVGAALNDALKNSGGTISYGSNGDSFVVYSWLASGGWWCVDSRTEQTGRYFYSYQIPPATNTYFDCWNSNAEPK